MFRLLFCYWAAFPITRKPQLDLIGYVKTFKILDDPKTTLIIYSGKRVNIYGYYRVLNTYILPSFHNLPLKNERSHDKGNFCDLGREKNSPKNP